MNTRIRKLRDVMKKKGVDAVLVTSEPNMFYLSGFTGTAGWLFITPSQKYILSDSRFWEQVENESPNFRLVKAERDDGTQGVKNILKRYPNIKKIGFEDDKVSFAMYKKLTKEINNVKFVALEGAVSELRMIKSEEEIKFIEKAALIANKALKRVLKIIKPGMTERYIASLLLTEIKELGAEKESFDFHVPSGANAALPHILPTDKKIKKNELIIIDLGAKYKGYCSDMTRTICLGTMSAKQEKIYKIVERAQKAAINYIKAGVVCGDVDKKARNLIEKEGYGKNFMHGLGHGTGIEIHEAPNFRPNVKTVLRPGMVLSVEPGIYISGFGGVRIEDLILVTRGGCRILTQDH